MSTDGTTERPSSRLNSNVIHPEAGHTQKRDRPSRYFRDKSNYLRDVLLLFFSRVKAAHELVIDDQLRIRRDVAFADGTEPRKRGVEGVPCGLGSAGQRLEL
jgi:hypothetical protein